MPANPGDGRADLQGAVPVRPVLVRADPVRPQPGVRRRLQPHRRPRRPGGGQRPGTVDRVTDLGGTSYGKYVRINHGGGYTTYYAHLNGFNVSVGQTVGYGKVLGWVGSTGGSTGPHLHYEQRLNGSDIQVRFNGALALYWGTKTYTSDNGCSSGTGNGTVTPRRALTVRSGPGTGYSSVGTVADGTRVTIDCQTSGTTVTGTYGTSSIWDRIGSGRYIADAYVYTGYDGYIPGVPRC